VVLLTQFLFRLALGLAAGMAITSPRVVGSGYFRNHLYVLLGLNVLAALVAVGDAEGRFLVWLPIAGAVVSYVGSVCWLYERPRAGVAALWIVAGLALAAAWLSAPLPDNATPAALAMHRLEMAGSGMLLGATMAAMLLGHWYLNSPGMKLAPLRRLVALMGAAVAFRAALSGAGLAAEISITGLPDTRWMLFILLRWLAGLVGTAVVVVLTWQTLKIPNTQAATGMLYVGVITTFLGELTAMLLSAETAFPL